MRGSPGPPPHGSSTGATESANPLVDKVLKAVDELGYIPNDAARTLVTRRTGAVAVVIAEPEIRIFSDPFFSQQIRASARS
ncbi:hypothetical protein SMICM17S_09294 [Streptomyces microflavus]